MTSGKRIGERLSNLIPLSGHDIEEILSEQNASGKRFGDIALELGKCTPEDIWRAWSIQLAEAPQQINLDQFAIDVQSIEYLPAAVAVRFHCIPIRVLNDELVIAVDEAAYPEVARELLAILHGKAQFVLSNHRDIAKAIRSYYPRASAA